MKRTWLIVFGDFVSFLASFIILIIIRFKAENYQGAIASHTLPFLILYLSWVFIFYVFGLYDLVTIKPTIPYLKRWILAILSALFVGILLFYFVPVFLISPKVNLIIQAIGFGFFSFFFRRIIFLLFSKAITRPTILVGTSTYLNELKNNIMKSPQIGLDIIEHYASIAEIKVENSQEKNILIILDKNESEIKNQDILNLFKTDIEIIDTAHAYEKYLYKIPVGYINLSYMIENIKIRKDIAYKFMTFLINIIFATSVIIILSPFLIISSLFIYFYDKGPIFYTQERVGLNGKIFKLYKLRSMKVNAEKDGAVWSTGADDNRVTPIGRIIRKLHIDEIPQMINILKGDLTLVGPRPERPEFVSMLEKEIPYYSFRHIIRPGFTGWAQIKYRYARTTEDSKEKFEYDLYYIKNKNIFLDIGIIIRTIQIIFTH